MFARIKTLTLMQLDNKMNKRQRKANSKSVKLVNFLVRVCIGIVVFFAIWQLLDFSRKMSFFRVDNNLFIFVFFISQFLSVLACTFGLANLLYSSKDHSIIFTMPARPTEIFLSKLAVYYISEFFKSIVFMIPSLFAFGLLLNMGIIYFLWTVLAIFLLPLFSVLIGTVLSFPLMFLKRLTKRYPIAKLFVAMAIIGLVVWLLILFVQGLPETMNLVAKWDEFYKGVIEFIKNANNYALIYGCLGWLFLGVNVWANLGIVLGTLAGLGILTYLITLAYFNLASKDVEYAYRRKKVGKNIPAKNTFFTFMKKEMITHFRNIERLIGHLIYMVALPFTLYFLGEVFAAINVSSIGFTMIITVNTLIGLLFLTASNTMSATAITSEGGEFSLIKTAPSQTWKICYAKLMTNFLLSLISIIITCIVLCFVGRFPTWYVAVIFFVYILISLAHMLWAFQLDLLKPGLHDYAATGSEKENKNVSISITLGLAIAVIVAALTFFFFNENSVFGVFKLLGVVFAFFLLRLYLFLINLKVYFKRIQP